MGYFMVSVMAGLKRTVSKREMCSIYLKHKANTVEIYRFLYTLLLKRFRLNF